MSRSGSFVASILLVAFAALPLLSTRVKRAPPSPAQRAAVMNRALFAKMKRQTSDKYRWLISSNQSPSVLKSELMNRSQAIQTALGISGFLLRHLVAYGVTVAVPCLLWTITYIALLLWAVFTNGGIGGPLAYPAGILVILIAATFACLLFLFPSTALAEWLAKRRRLPIFAQIPISVGILALLCFIVAGVVASSDASQWFQGFSIGFGLLFAAHLLPLGLYWWTVQSGPLLFLLYQRLRSAFGAGQQP